jgi:colanic acid/amylovoran biosynthesis glycosyltransferase
MNETVRSFYDGFSRRLLADYVHGNQRMEAAIRHCLTWLPVGARRILDVGCGIGWSTWEIKRNHREAFVLGIDFSPQMIRIAQRLFVESQLAFASHDITECGAILETPFDVIVMLDVYEHIPKESREKFHDVLDKTLAPGGTIILTCPSLSHQQFLRNQHPHELQPIDEDVAEEDVSKLARDINGEVILCEHVSIWRPSDYVHIALTRDSHSIQENGRQNRSIATLEQQPVRSHRADSRLKAHVTREGIMLPQGDGPVVCVISPNKEVYSETFIRAHIERLPARVKLLYGGSFPTHMEDDKPLLAPQLTGQALRFLSYQLLNLSPQYFKNRALERFLRNNEVNVVLAEYGPTGASVLDTCSAASVPLVVHFHGYDAYDQKTLKEYSASYRRMFVSASAVIAVSRDMERRLLELGAPREKLFYNPCGVDATIFSEAAPDVAPPLFVAVGRFVDKKGPHLTILAFKEVLDECPDARLVMIGDGPLLETCKQLAEGLRIAAKVDFLGVRPHTEVAAAVRGARAFVQHSVKTSYGDSEGTPVAVLEAGASGLPVVATRHGGIVDVVTDGLTGFLVDEGDVEGMAIHMIELARHPDLAGRIGRAARQRVIQEFSMDKSIERLWSIIARAAGLS